MKTSYIPIILSIVLFLAFVAPAQITDQQKAEIDKLFEQWDKKDSPGAAVGVIKDGKLIYSNGYGAADLEHDVQLTPKSVFYMASVSKQFVTFAILLMEEQGKLGLDDEIQKHLPDFPRYKDPLTIRHFIHHTSGVRDSLTLWSLTGKDIYDTVDKDAMYDLLKRQKELNFKPGDQYLYSNACYFMLAEIVEKASGKSIKEFAEEHMFKPLGMKNTHFHDDQYHIVKNRVFSYRPAKEGYQNLIMRFDLVGSGGLYSSIEDMYLWDQNFYNNKLGKGGQSIIKKMETDGLLNNGKSAGYAFGLTNGTYIGHRTVGHGGALAGYRTYSIRYPDEKFSVIVLSNVANFNPGGKSRSIAKIFLKDNREFQSGKVKEASELPKKAASKTPQQKPSESQLETYTASYFSRSAGISARVFLDGKDLRLQTQGGPVVLLKHLDKDIFMLDDPNQSIVVDFENTGGDQKKMKAVINGGAPISFVSYKPVNYSESDLKEFTGTFFSEEINAFYQLKLEKDALVVYINDRKVESLKPMMKDLFRSPKGTYFEFDETGFTLDAGRVKGLKFVKTD